jgi:hypothetical protein
MKIRMYMDFWTGLDPARSSISATNTPCSKVPNAKRIAFDVTVPDALIFDHDGVAPEVSPIGLVADKDIPSA